MAKKTKKTPVKPRPAATAAAAPRAAAAAPVPKARPTVTPLVGLSLDKGLLISVMTGTDDADLADFRMAIDRPFFKMLPAPAAKCRSSHAVIRDQKAGLDRKSYVAFIPAPAHAVIEGPIPCGARFGKESLFFTVPTEPYAKIDREKLRKILYVLHPQFEAVLPHVLPEKHPLRVEFAAITAARKRNEAWQAVQAQVKTHLEAKEPAKALAVLEPLVFSQQPLVEAEKLLGELLYAAKRPKRTEGDAEVAEEESAEIKALRMEQLLLEFTVSRLTRSEKPADKAPAPKANASPKATPAPVRRAIPTPKRRVAV